MTDFLINNAILGLGMGGFMVPLSTYALATLSRQDITEGSGLFGYSRMLGTSIGISILSTLVSRTSQISWNSLSGHVSTFSSQYQSWLVHQHLTANSPIALMRLSHVMANQSGLLSFIDGYKVIALVFLALVPLILLLKYVDLNGASPSAH